jgi:hypothetical protein
MIRTRVIAAAGVVVLLAGCTPPPTPASPTASTTAATATPSASASPARDANQAAAVVALEGYRTTAERIYSDPTRYSSKEQRRMWAQYVGADMMNANIASVSELAKDGERRLGSPVSVWTEVSDAVDNHNSRGLEVHITVCQDYSAVKVVDAAGSVVASPKSAFGVRQFSVRKPGTAWRIFGETAASGECHR